MEYGRPDSRTNLESEVVTCRKSLRLHSLDWPSHAAEPGNRGLLQASVAALLETIRIVSFSVQPLTRGTD